MILLFNINIEKMRYLFVAGSIACLVLYTSIGYAGNRDNNAIDRWTSKAEHPNIPDVDGATTGWKAGVGRVNITPDYPIWLAGYTSRKHASAGKLHDLWAKALAIEDASGNRSVLITTDLEEISKAMSDRIRDQINLKYNLSRAQIILNCSHTHSSPIIREIAGFYTDDPEELNRVNKYCEKLELDIVSIVGMAFQSLEPVVLYAQNGVARFQTNRRNNIEYKLPLEEQVKGPNDYAVPVIKVVSNGGKLLAIAFGYACHNTVSNDYELSGDFAGFAQLELEKLFPGTTALFFQGAGGNQIAYPRRSIAAAVFHGKTLAAAVERVLSEEMQLLSPKLATAYAEVNLPISKSPSIEELREMARDESLNDKRRWAQILVDSLQAGKRLKTYYPYPIQVWKVGEQVIFSLGGEVVVEYAIQLKRIFGRNIFVAAYCNDVMAYIPSAAILNEGGYEPVESITSSSGCLPSPWAVAIEPIIFMEILNLAKQIDVPLSS